MYREFNVNFHLGLRQFGSPRYFEDGECSVVQDCYVDNIGNIFSRKFKNKITTFSHNIKTLFFYNYINSLVVHLVNGDFRDLNNVSISQNFGGDRLSCVEYNNILHMVNGNIKKRYDGTNVQDIGNDHPTTAPTASTDGAGNLDGNYYWKYTYVDSNGKESNYSPASTVLAASSNKVQVAVTASSDSKVSSISLYRLGGTLAQWFLVSSGNANTTGNIEDNVADSDLSTIGDAENNDPPSFGLRFLIEHYNRIIGAKTVAYPNSVEYTVQYEPEYWGDDLSQQYLISNQDDCTGLLSWGRYVIFCKINRKYVLEGENPEFWHLRKSDAFTGNISPAALSFYNYPITLSYFGLHLFDGNNDVSFSEKIRDFFKTYKSYLGDSIGCVFDDKYFLSLPDADVVLIYDFSTKLFYTYNIKATDIYYDYKNTLLYIGDSNNNLCTLENDNNLNNYDSLNFRIKSKMYSLNNKLNEYGQLRLLIVNINTNGQNVSLKIYIDEVLKQTMTLNTSSMTRLRESCDAVLKGKYAEFEFECLNATRQIEIQPPILVNPDESQLS